MTRLACAVSLLLLTHCAQPVPVPVPAPTITLRHFVLTSTEQLSHGKRSAVHVFGVDDTIVQFVTFVWDDPSRSGGTHTVDWRWFQGGRLMSQFHKAQAIFQTTPWTLRTGRTAASLGRGDFAVETIVDDQVVATSRFTIE